MTAVSTEVAPRRAIGELPPEIQPVGLCQCGCGQRTRLSLVTSRRARVRKGEPRRFLAGHAIRVRPQSGPANPSWKGGVSAHPEGYVSVTVRGGRKLEHVVVAEGALGKPLPRGAVVHHVDENRANNAPSNLVICPGRGYHALLHRRMRALAECGNPNAHRCRRCGGYDNQDDIYVSPNPRHFEASHRACLREQARRRCSTGVAQ